MASIELRKIEKRFGEVRVVSPLDLEIRDGEFVVLLGPSGCGKTTLLRMIAGLEEATAGDILIDAEVVTHKRARERNVAMVFQNYALYPHLTVAQNLAFPLEAQGVPNRQIQDAVEAVAMKLGLAELLARKPSQLSGGQRQRVAVGRAMVRNPKVFLFDEPLSNLDASLREGMRSELIKLHASLRNTIVYVTHDQVEAMTMAERIVVLRDGEVQQIGSPMEVYATPRNVFVAQFIGSPSMNIVAGILHRAAGEARLMVDESEVAIARGVTSAGTLKVKVGFRPTDVALTAEPSSRAECLNLPVKVTAVQPLGHDVLVDVASLLRTWGAVVQVPWKTFTGKIDDRFTMHIPTSAIHLFDATKGLRQHLPPNTPTPSEAAVWLPASTG